VTTSLAEHGFLSDETAGVVDAVEQRYAAWLTLLRSVNGRAVKAQYEAQIPRAYLPALVAAACYMRTLTNIQGAVLLIMRGLEPCDQMYRTIRDRSEHPDRAIHYLIW
jgi:hypothetical protein